MEGKNSKETLDEDNKRREFFDKQGERLEFYDSLICQLGDIVKEFARVVPPVVTENDGKRLLLAKKIFKDNYEAYIFLLNHELESILKRATRLATYDKNVAGNDIRFLEKSEAKCEQKMIEQIRDYYAEMASHADADMKAEAQRKLNEFLQ